MPATAGYSLTPLAKKPGIAPGSVVCAVGAPANYRALFAPVPDGVTFTDRVGASTDVVHLFARERAALRSEVCAVDKTWSGLKLVIRRELRR